MLKEVRNEQSSRKGGVVRYVKTRNITKLERQTQKIRIRLEHKRMDYENKVVNELVRTKPSRIVMEHLNIRGMMKTAIYPKPFNNNVCTR